MPRISDRVSNCALYLYTTKEAALAGGSGGATAFAVFRRADDVTLKFFDAAHFYVVTARHVVGGGATFLRVNVRQDRPEGANLGPVDVVEIRESAWIPHPDGDDVTIAPLFELDEKVHDVRAFDIDLAVTQDDLRSGPRGKPPANVGRGDEAFFIGRFRAADGGPRNEPTVRFGNIAMLPTPLRSDVTGLMQESFLVEARSIGGYSGSPVFTYQAADLTDEGEVRSLFGNKLYFLGVDWCHVPDWQPVYDKDKHTKSEPRQWVKGNTGMAGVVPAWKVTQLLEEPILVDERKKDEADRLKYIDGGNEGASDMEAPDDDEFDRFENLARKLVNTPKPTKPETPTQ